jgi:hypothetical protein
VAEPERTIDIAEQDIIDILREREAHWGAWRARVKDIDLLAAGRWGEVFQTQGEADTEYPMIANLFRNTIEDHGRMFAEAVPQDRVDLADPDDTEGAELREKILVSYNHGSYIYDQLEYIGQDFPAAGITGIKVWPDMGTPLGKRFPRMERVNPRVLLPEPRWTPYRPSDNVMLHYSRPATDLVRQFGDPVRRMIEQAIEKKRGRRINSAADLSSTASIRREIRERGLPTNIDVADLYTSDFACRMLLIRDGDKVLARYMATVVPIPFGMCPVQLAARPSWTEEPTGSLDDSKGVARTRNRYFRIILDYFIEMVYGPTVTWNILDPDPRKPIWKALSKDALAQRIGPQNMSYQALQILDIMEKEERTGKVAPLSREGEVDLNKASAAFLTRAQGQLNSVVKSSHRSFGAAKQRANEIAMAEDEEWCNGADKEITGKLRGRRFRVVYTPKEAIGGDYSNRVSYGTASGLDMPTHQVLNLQKLGRTLSEQTFMENDPMLDDYVVERSRLLEENMRRQILEGLATLSMPDKVKAMKAFRQAKTVDELIEMLERDKVGVEKTPTLPSLEGTPAGELMGGSQAGLPSGLGPPGVAEAEQPVVLPPQDALRRLVGRR